MCCFVKAHKNGVLSHSHFLCRDRERIMGQNEFGVEEKSQRRP